jgi:protein-S-isoprenylcysteine O-methyltransferase Ste14
MTAGLPLCFALFCFASFAWAMNCHFRRAGGPSRAMIITALLAAACAILQLVVLAQRQLPHPIAAVALYGSGSALFWWAVAVTRGKLAACGQGWVSPEVVTAGPYRLVRHPFYTAYNMVWAAGFAATAWWPLALAAVVMVIRYDQAAREEEQGFATGALAEEYAAYRRRTGKYLPRIRR